MTDTLGSAAARVSWRDIRAPYLNVVAIRDHIVPPSASLAGARTWSAPTDKQELLLDAGHIGLAVGRNAHKITIPQISAFLRQRSRPVVRSPREHQITTLDTAAHGRRRPPRVLRRPARRGRHRRSRRTSATRQCRRRRGRHRGARRWVALDEGEVAATPRCYPGSGSPPTSGSCGSWSRGATADKGLGRALARTVLLAALNDGLSQGDRRGACRRRSPPPRSSAGWASRARRCCATTCGTATASLSDLLVLAHFADENSSVLTGLGVENDD